MSALKIVPPREIIDANLMTVRRFRNGSRKQIKMLKLRFADSITSGKIFGQIVNHNRSLQEQGKKDDIKYYAAIPTSKNVWALKKICYELKEENVFLNVRGCDRGVLVSYKCMDDRNSGKEVTKNSLVTCESDIDDLRIKLNVDDAFIPVKEKYNNNYWSLKRKPALEFKSKRFREADDTDELNIAKKVSSTPKN